MPTGTLSFNLPDEQYLFETAIKAGPLHSALCEIREYLRSQRKYADLKPDAKKAFDEMWEHYHTILSENAIDQLFV